MNRLHRAAFLIAVFTTTSLLAQTPGDKLSKLFEDEWEYTLRESPTFASHLGDKRYNDRWPDSSIPGMQKRHDHQVSLLKRLQEFDEAALSTTA